MSLDYEFTGFEALGAKMDALAVEISGKAMVKMVRAGAKVFKEAIEERAPVLDKKTPGSSSLDPGAIKEGITISMPKGDLGIVTAIVGPGKGLRKVAYDVEFGHRQIHKKKVGGGKSKAVAGNDVPPHPFIRPAYEAGIAPAESAMVASMEKSIKEGS